MAGDLDSPAWGAVAAEGRPSGSHRKPLLRKQPSRDRRVLNLSGSAGVRISDLSFALPNLFTPYQPLVEDK